jgi:hypothetical protein
MWRNFGKLRQFKGGTLQVAWEARSQARAGVAWRIGIGAGCGRCQGQPKRRMQHADCHEKFLFRRGESSGKAALRGRRACLYCAREVKRSG